MLDWKILAASIVALLFISSLFIGGLGIRDFLSGILQKISEYLGSSPFGDVLSSTPQEKGEKDISLILSPQELTLQPDAAADLITGETRFTGFTGEIHLFFHNATVELTSSSFSITFPLTTLNITSLTLTSLSLTDTKLEIKPDISTDSGDLQLTDFSGFATATPQGIELNGKVSSLLVTIGELNFELV